MKLSALFAKFLYQNKELKLPGIGVFHVDPSITVPELGDKNFPDFIQHIKYLQTPVVHADDAFINFIRTETGKIRPLAESDLDSFLSDGKILLNIGKPFHIEGVGFLQKTREGKYEFTAGEPVMQRLENIVPERNEDGSRSKTFLQEVTVQHNGIRKFLIAAGAVTGIVLIVWGGYTLYNRNASRSTSDAFAAVSPDSSRANIILDSVQKMIDSATIQQSRVNAFREGSYKFVIERTANPLRARRRFDQVREQSAMVQLDSNPSKVYSLYFVLPAQPSDTARVRDSLKVWYGRRVVFVERDKVNEDR